MDPLRKQLEKALGGTYRIERELGGGGMSRVFLAVETAFDRQVVLKVLPPELVGSVSADRFMREIATAARLQHAHIVPLHSAGDADGLPWFSMPYVEGETLRARLKRGELPVGDAVRIMRDLASALGYAHNRGVVHRDIKPENVLFADGAALLADFGVARAIAAAAPQGSTLTSIGVALGTPAYMAPEQAAADDRTDHRADIYALGVMAYEMLAGHNPFGGRSPQATLIAHMTEKPVAVDAARPAIPPQLARLVMRCLAKSAADRPQSASEIVQELDTIATPSGIMPPLSGASAVAFPPPIIASRWTRRRVVAVIAAAVALAAAGVWGVTRLGGGSDLDPRTIAVMPFDAISSDTAGMQAARVAADWLIQGIVQTDSASVVSSAMVEFALGDEAGGDPVSRVARATHAGTVITGSVDRFGDSLRFQATIVSAVTGRVIRAIDPIAAPVADPLMGINALRDRVVGAIASGDAARQVSMAGQPPRYSAYREYLSGREVYAVDQPASVAYFRRAIALDSTFAAPYTFVAARWVNAGRRDSAEVYVNLLERLRERLSPYDLLMLDYARASVKADLPGQLATAQAAFAKVADPVMQYLVGRAAVAMLRLDLAIPALEGSDSAAALLKFQPSMTMLADAYHLAGDHQREADHVALARRRYPNATAWVHRRLRVLGAQGGAAEAVAVADTILRGQTDPTSIGGLDALSLASWEFHAHGDSATANRLNELGLRWVAAHPPARRSAGWHRTVGRAWLDLGNADSALVHLRASVTDTSSLGPGTAGYIAFALIMRGDSAGARATADSLAQVVEKYPTGFHPYWAGSIFAMLGEKDRAVQMIGIAHQQGLSKVNWHINPALRSLRGYPPFEALITPVK